jgi:hypothetical protein
VDEIWCKIRGEREEIEEREEREGRGREGREGREEREGSEREEREEGEGGARGARGRSERAYVDDATRLLRGTLLLNFLFGQFSHVWCCGTDDAEGGCVVYFEHCVPL